MDDPDPLDAAIARLSLAELRRVQEEIARRIAALEQEDAPVPLTPGRAVVAETRDGQITYRQELIRCGKPTCRCAAGQLHGPVSLLSQRRAARE